VPTTSITHIRDIEMCPDCCAVKLLGVNPDGKAELHFPGMLDIRKEAPS
jgi:hypothetical protein